MDLFKDTNVYTVKRCHNRDEWLEARKSHIGGSEAASFMGVGFKTVRQLWHQKIKNEPDDFKGNALTEYGAECEPILRDLFRLKYPELDVQYVEDCMLINNDHPYMSYSPDGLIYDSISGMCGILEIKTYHFRNRDSYLNDWGSYDCPSMPDKYYCQVLHGLNVTGFDFVYLIVEIVKHNSSEIQIRYLDAKDVFVAKNRAELFKAIRHGWQKYFIGYEEPPVDIYL